MNQDASVWLVGRVTSRVVYKRSLLLEKLTIQMTFMLWLIFYHHYLDMYVNEINLKQRKSKHLLKKKIDCII